MPEFTWTIVNTKIGESIRVLASSFAGPEVQVILQTKELFDQFQQSRSTGAGPVILQQIEAVSLTPSRPEHVFKTAPGEWYVMFQSWRAQVSCQTVIA